MRRSAVCARSIRAAVLASVALTLSGPGVLAVGAGPPELTGNPATPSPSPLSGLEKTILELTRDERNHRQSFEDLGRRLETARTRAHFRGRAYLRRVRAGLLPIGGGFAAMIEHAATLERLRRSIEKDLAEARELIGRRARIVEQLNALGRRLAPLRADHEALARAESALSAAEDRERAFERAFERSQGTDHTAIYGAVGPTEPGVAVDGFESMRGRLPFPIAGRSEVKSARRKSSEGPGLELHVRFGTPVRAVYPGRVAFADEYADYGKTVIVDHGGGFYTVSANLGSIDVRVGDDLTTGVRVGSAGESKRGALVYFEIRRGTTSVDPAEWFGL